ncbi:MAG: M23 family metallopeptidase [Elusimicrobia bacterium]|nr:M23 family metallopeptidase [Elusimicrobiota bacterium]
MRRFLLVVLLLAGCKSAEKVAREVMKATPAGRKILPQFDRYAKIAHVLKGYHDGAPLDDKGILEVLRNAGVIPGKTPQIVKVGGPKPSAPKPFPVPEYKGHWRWPLEAGVVSSEYGKRWGKNHNGLDIAADLKVPVFAAAPGEVLYSGNQVSGYGNLLVLRHDEKTTTFYGHNDSLKVKTGDKVEANQVIALLGSTGRSTGPHVHFEIREKDKPLDPRARLPKNAF